VWIPDEEEGYIAGEIKKTEGNMNTVVVAGGTEVFIRP
jgi:hypothetical protein